MNLKNLKDEIAAREARWKSSFIFILPELRPCRSRGSIPELERASRLTILRGLISPGYAIPYAGFEFDYAIEQ
jgi:hypothetical protein